MAVHKVTYKGLSDIREMTRSQLKDAGVDMPKDLVWDKTKHGRLPKVFIENISDRMLEIFRDEGTFTVSEVKDESLQELDGVEPLVEGRELDDTGSVLRDGTTGQTSTAGEPDANADPTPPSGTEATATGSTGRGRSTKGRTS